MAKFLNELTPDQPGSDTGLNIRMQQAEDAKDARKPTIEPPKKPKKEKP